MRWPLTFSLLAGLFAGAVLYQASSLAWLYSLDGRYLTFTQPRALQSVARLYDSYEPANKERYLIFGGSAAYHAIHETLLAERLAEHQKDAEVLRVSFPSQKLIDTLGLIEALPPATTSNEYVVLTWSFWRFSVPGYADVAQALNYDRSLFHNSAALAALSDEGLYATSELARTGAPSWEAFAEEANLPRTGSLLTIWTKYFFLDKVQKLLGGRFAYLFKDPPIDERRSEFNEKRLDDFRTLMARDATKKRVAGTIEFQRGKFDKVLAELTPEQLERRVEFATTLMARSQSAAQAKGYRFVLIQLPINDVALADGRISDFRDAFSTAFSERLGKESVVTYQPTPAPLAAPEAWWDLVHVTKLGAVYYNERLAQLLSKRWP